MIYCDYSSHHLHANHGYDKMLEYGKMYDTRDPLISTKNNYDVMKICNITLKISQQKYFGILGCRNFRTLTVIKFNMKFYNTGSNEAITELLKMPQYKH